MRYFINFDKTINQLVPYYIGGRKLILYLQALMSPLSRLNDDFVTYAKETRIEAAMTSQIFKFEWYLNRKFRKYFANGGRISIKNSESLGAPIYKESANIDVRQNMLVYYDNETDITRQLVLYRSDEQTEESSVSFIVTTPQIDTKLISEQKYVAMLKYVIDRYRLANKTYIIKYESK
nr:MAG TPA: hypothetical protein [Caudoviricetes sp.]